MGRDTNPVNAEYDSGVLSTATFHLRLGAPNKSRKEREVVPVHNMKAYWGSGGIDPLTLKLGTM